jgi:hypothetical protein
MADREQTYRNFGPMMLEAIVRLIFSEINILRQRASLEPRTVQQGLDALKNQIDQLEEYEWQKEQRENGMAK